MKSVLTVILFATGICSTVLLTAGCGTLSPEERTALVSETSGGLNRLINQSRQNSMSLQDSVTALTQAGPDDLQARYAAFEMNAEALRSISEEVKDVSREMNEETVAFFKEWENRLALSPDKKLQETGKVRSAHLMDHYSAIAESMEQLEELYHRYERDIADIEKILGNDPTPAGLETVNSALVKVTRNAGPMDEATQRVLDGLDELITLLRQ